MAKDEGNAYGVPVDRLVDDVKEAIRLANLSDGSTDLRVTAVHLVLNVVATTKVGGGLDFRVPFIGMRLKIGTAVTRQDTHTIRVTLVPPQVKGYPVRDDVPSVLVEAVETIRTVIARAASGEPEFGLGTAEVELEFVVDEDGTISLGVEGELQKGVTHSVKLEIGPAS